MKYLIIGLMSFMVAFLLFRVFMAVNIESYNIYDIRAEKESKAQLEETGKSLYLVYCSSCHGANGKGNNNKAQDHTKRIAEKSVLEVIQNGANNFRSVYPSGMPAGLLKLEDAKEVAAYVAGGLKGKKPKGWGICASCHDISGEGIAFVAPNIKNYSDELVATVLQNGKKGVIGRMPSFANRLSLNQMQSLAAHIRTLGSNAQE